MGCVDRSVFFSLEHFSILPLCGTNLLKLFSVSFGSELRACLINLQFFKRLIELKLVIIFPYYHSNTISRRINAEKAALIL